MAKVGDLLKLLLVPAALLCAAPAGADDPAGALRAADLPALDQTIREQLRAGHVPGAVVLIGDRAQVLYRKAFGYAALKPAQQPMRVDTVFDLASLTKVVATTTAVMQLVEQGRLRLDDPVAAYWPAFAANGKGAITVRQALTHYSGLRPDLSLSRPWRGYAAALDLIAAETPVTAPGSTYDYSDINFEVLGELVRRVSGQPLDAYCRDHIFAPLGMRNTGFLPPPGEDRRIAATGYRDGANIRGAVNDPTALRMGGVAGHAGLFADADDLARFARMLLGGGSLDGTAVLQPDSVALMTSPQVLPDRSRQHGLGWDLDAPPGERGVLVPPGFYGHTGYTGTSLWIDPVTGTYVVILSNRVYPDNRGDIQPLRNAVATAVGTALGMPGAAQWGTAAAAAAPVQSGLDVIAAHAFAPLAGRRVGLITNQSGIDARGRSAVELLRRAPQVQLVALFSPEHGLSGQLDQKIASGTDPRTSLPVYSLYGDVQRPTGQMLQDVDALVFDIQDAGVRFYTYITTLGYAMEAAARAGIDFYVLDRPALINASEVQGPVLDDDLRSFTAYYPLPVRYGMTAGELATLFNAENHIGARLHVIRMRGYRRDDWYDQTGLSWVNPSPNLRSQTQAALYPGVALVEGANVSVGRGTDSPFELLGAPWINSLQLARYLHHRHIAGVEFLPANFTPDASIFSGRTCHGVRIVLRDRDTLDAPALGVEIASALHSLYPEQFQLQKTLGMIGTRTVLEAIRRGEDPRAIAAGWQDALHDFRALRARYLLY